MVFCEHFSQWLNIRIVLLLVGACDAFDVAPNKVLLKYIALVSIIKACVGDVAIVPPKHDVLHKQGITQNKDIADVAKTLNVSSFPCHKTFVKGKIERTAYFVDGVYLVEPRLKALVKTIKYLESKLYIN